MLLEEQYDGFKKKNYYSIEVVAFIILGLIVFIGFPYLSIDTSYAAKITSCSYQFISGRSVEDIVANDLYAVDMVQVDANYAAKIVTSSFYGLAK